MSQIENQQQIVERLYHIVAGSMPVGVKEASCCFDYKRFEDGSSSVGQRFTYKQDNQTVSAALDRELRKPVIKLVKQLHRSMMDHTGGDWNAFTLTIDEDGRANTKFEYSE